MTGLAVFCSDKIDFRSRQEQSCPTTADETPYPHPHFQNFFRQMAVLAISSYFIFSCVKRRNYCSIAPDESAIRVPNLCKRLFAFTTYISYVGHQVVRTADQMYCG